MLADRASLEILAHRMVWAFVFYLLIYLSVAYRQSREWPRLERRDWILSSLAALLLAVNWGIYIYAVNNNHVLESSLAYFINPILNVAVGVLFFREPFPLILRLSVAFAAAGVAARIALSPGWPWISLMLATTFCAYGVTKKLLKIPVMTSSVLEGSIGLVPALIAVFYFQQSDPAPISAATWLLFVFGGVVTGLPLFLFSYAAQLVPYSIMGMLQFIAPTLQFLVGIYAFHEVFGHHDMISFGLIWVGIAFYLSYHLVARARREQTRPR